MPIVWLAHKHIDQTLSMWVRVLHVNEPIDQQMHSKRQLSQRLNRRIIRPAAAAMVAEMGRPMHIRVNRNSIFFYR